MRNVFRIWMEHSKLTFGTQLKIWVAHHFQTICVRVFKLSTFNYVKVSLNFQVPTVESLCCEVLFEIINLLLCDV